MTIKYLLQKEFIQIFRNPFLPRLIFVFPIVVICVMPWVMSMEVQNINVQVVDNDRSTTSRQLIHEIEQSQYFIFAGQVASYGDALENMEKGLADIILEVPPHYEHDLATGRSPQVLIAANAANSTKGAIGSGYLSQIVTSAISTPLSRNQMQWSMIDLYNNHLSYKVFMIPALMGILMMMMCGYLPALNIVSEKENGTIEQINVTPVKKAEFILAKLIPYWLIGMAVMTVCIILAWLLYDITCQGNLAWIYLLSLLLALFFSGLGLCISNYSDTMQQAVLVMWFFVVMMMLMSGMFTPVRSMPEWAQIIVTANPMYYFTDSIRTIFVRGGNLESILPQLLSLAAFAFGLDLWAILSYRKNN